MRRVLLAFSLTILGSCSDPPGWTLWKHAYLVTDDERSTVGANEWHLYDSYPALGDCTAQISLESAKAEKAFEKARDRPEAKDHKIIFQREKQGIKMTVIPSTASEKDKPYTQTIRFFCLPIGMDPRPKDPVTWTLWREEFSGRSGRTDYHSWQPEEDSSYLTEVECRRVKEFQQEIQTPDNEKPAKEKVSRSTYYHCYPSTVAPWGKEEYP
jgi:hypothetical protein